MTMKHFTYIPYQYSHGQEQNAIKAAQNAPRSLWQQITVRQLFPGSDHVDTETIYLRGPRVWDAESYMGLGNAIDYLGNQEALPAIVGLVRAACQAIGATDLGYVMVVKLRAGGVVTPHVDEGEYADHYTRFHLVLTSNSRCVFYVGEERQEGMLPGELWQFDHKARHGFRNDGPTDRIHVIFDAVPDPALGLHKKITGRGVCIADAGGANIAPMLQIRASTVDEMLQVAPVLFKEHWDEIARNKQVMVLKPNEQAYRAMEQAGQMMILAAYKGDEMVGYSVNFIINHPHYADLVVCQNDLLYIAQAHREGGVGIRLMKRTEQEGKARGARLMLWHAKQDTPLANILPRMAYGVQDIIFSKEL